MRQLMRSINYLFFEFYTNETALVENIMPIKDNLQCIVSKFEIDSLKTLRFGCTQEPSIFDFADDVWAFVVR